MLTLNNIDSSAISSLSIDKEKRTAQVEFQNGQQYTYFDVNRGAIASVLEDPKQSIGSWVSTNLVRNKDVNYTLGFVAA